MANRTLFKTRRGKQAPPTNAVNEALGRAYALPPQHALAQYAATGCLSRTFYASETEQLETVLRLAGQVRPEFVAKAAIYARQRGQMKDMPALLCAALSVLDAALLERVFARVIDNGRMLRNFVQIVRSGVVGRKSLGSLPKRLVRQWLESRSDEALFRASIGRAPSLADIVKMVHPVPASAERAALYGYLIGRDVDAALLPDIVRQYEAFKRDPQAPLPDVPHELLTALPLNAAHWRAIARQASWQTTRMNLNTFLRHGVFEDTQATRAVTERLRDPEAIRKARVLPYQLLVAYCMTGTDVPARVRAALQDALESATAHVPELAGQVYVFPDVSGSMHAAVTGVRKGATSAVRCINVAALVTACVVRRNPEAEVIPFHAEVVRCVINPRDSIMSNAQMLAALPSGGTNCSAPLRRLNERRAAGDLVIYVSDNQSWIDVTGGAGTATMQEWSAFKQRNPQARLVCIDVQPYGTVQTAEREDVLNIGGFSDHVFELLAEFAAGRLHAEHWVGVIEAIEL